MFGVPRRCLQRYNLRYPISSPYRYQSKLSNYHGSIGVAQYHTLLSSTHQHQLPVCRSEYTIPTNSSSNNARYFTSIFRNSMMNNHLSDTHQYQQPSDNSYNPSSSYETSTNNERKYRRQYEDTTRRGSLSPNTTNRGSRTNNSNKPNRGRQKIHNVRLIQESAAIETIQLFRDGYDDFISASSCQSSADSTKDNIDGSISNSSNSVSNVNDKSYPWNNATSLLGAEQTLEYYARCNKSKKHLPLEDVESALRLFTILHSLHHVNNPSSNSSNNSLRNNNRKLILTNGMYSHIIDILSKSKSIQHVELANTLLQQFIGLYISNVIQNMDVNVLLGMIDTDDVADVSVTNNTSDTFADSEDTNQRQQHDLSNSPNRIKWNYQDHFEFPNQVRITGVMRGYAQTCTNPIKAEELLHIMIELSNNYGNNKDQQERVGGRAVNEKEQRRNIFQPNEFTYATVIDAYSRIHDGTNAERILQLMKQYNKPNVVAFNTAITAWSRCTKDGSKLDINDVKKSREAADNAERLLREMWIEHDKLQVDEERISRFPSRLLPDVISYSSVVSAYATCFDQPYGMERAHELVIELEGLAKQEYINNQGCDGGDGTTNDNSSNNWQQRRSMNNRIGRNQNGFQPNTMVYNTLLQVYAEEGDASTAEQILQSMITLHSQSIQVNENGGGGPSGPFRFIKPNVRTFNVVLNAWAKSDDKAKAGVRAMKLLNCMMDDEIVEPDVVSYNTALNAWSSSASVDPASIPEVHEEGDSEEGTIKPIVGEDAAYEALKLLDKIEEQYIHQFQANSDDEIHVDKPSFDKERYKKLDKNAKARSRPYNIRISYSTTIAAFANAAQHSKDNGIALAEQAEGILNRMIDKLDIEPDAYGMNGVILAWARSSGGMKAAEHAESLFRSMKIPPTIVSWSSVVNAYALADGAHKAEALLQEMEENGKESSKGRITPTTVLCNNVLHSWGKSSESDASRNAEKLLERMESTTLPRPDVISYRIVLTALEHCLDHDKAERAKSVHDRFIASLDNSPVKVDPLEIQNAYNSVLTACAYTPADAGEEHRSKAGNILVGCLRDINLFPWSSYDNDYGSVVGPNQETYALFMQGCSHLYDSESVERNEYMKAAFRECCKQGLLNDIIWNKFCTAMGQEMMKEFIQEILPGSSQHFLDYKDLPVAWSARGSLD